MMFEKVIVLQIQTKDESKMVCQKIKSSIKRRTKMRRNLSMTQMKNFYNKISIDRIEFKLCVRERNQISLITEDDRS